MDENRQAGGPEVDDSQNPTTAAPFDPGATTDTVTGDTQETGSAAAADESGFSSGHAAGGASGGTAADPAASGSSGREWEPRSGGGAWGPGEVRSRPTGGAGAPGSRTGQQMVGQLQGMIDEITTQARPVLREIAAKAAELAAIAGEKAGPIAQRAADATQAAGEKVAAKGKEVAADLRRSGESEAGGGGGGDQPTASGSGASGDYPTSAVGSQRTGDESGSEPPPAPPAAGI